MRHRPLNGMVNERPNGSETGTRIENKENNRAGNFRTEECNFWSQ
jgi:hypothetical protein